MTRWRRFRAEVLAEWRSFTRQRTAVFFTFLFPVILVVIFGALVRSESTGLFSEPPVYYLPGYLGVVVLFTPLSRVSSTVTRHRNGRRFEKLATTPLTRTEWFSAHIVVNLVLVGIASALILVLATILTNPAYSLSILLLVFLGLGVVVFCGIGGLIGRFAASQDGAIAVSNTIGLPVLFLSETFVPPALLPTWFRPVIAISPLTYVARGSRAAFVGTVDWVSLGVLFGVTLGIFVLAVVLIPWRSTD